MTTNSSKTPGPGQSGTTPDNKKKERRRKRRSECRNDHKMQKGPRIVLWIALSVVVLAFLAISPFMLGGSDGDVIIRIPRNATYADVSDSLHKYFSDSYANRVAYLLKVHHVDFSQRHGSYEIKTGTSPFFASRRLAHGASTPVRITINHFRDLPTLAKGISNKADITAEQFIAAATDSAMLASHGLTPEQALSLFMEDTYEIYWNDSAEKIVERIGKYYDLYWSADSRTKAADIGLTPAQIMTIASIVDEETNKADEKGRIGQLYINRLNTGMRLQADPTVRFAVGNFSIQRVTREHLQTPSPYNTYRVNGLPPGPIRTTSRRTLDAILDSKPTDDLYMCAREDFSGYHNFARTYAEHTQNALRYQHELDRRGIK